MKIMGEGCHLSDISTFFQPSEFAERFLQPEGCRPQKLPLLYWNFTGDLSTRDETSHIDRAVPEHRAARLGLHERAALRQIRFVVHRAVAMRGSAAHRRADIAIIPAIEYQRIPDLVVLPDLAIASQNRVRSLLLVSKKPIEQVEHFALDRSSRSTQALTRILCAETWKIAPSFLKPRPICTDAGERGRCSAHRRSGAANFAWDRKRASQPAGGRAVCQAATLGITSAEFLRLRRGRANGAN